MKKILSLTLAVLMVVSMIPTAFAAETQDVSLGTAVTVEGAGGEYTITVPATLTVNQVGTVTAKGYWASVATLKVSAPETIEVTNTATSQKATVNVDFDGIDSKGDDLNEMNIPVNISIDAGNTKFGTWTGTIVYDVDFDNGMTKITVDGQMSMEANPGETWAEWIARKPYAIANYMYISAEHDNAILFDGTKYCVNEQGEIQYADTVIVAGNYSKGDAVS